MSDYPIAKDINVAELYFDPQNPRFAALSFNRSDESEVIKYMLKEQSLIDLIVSIAEQGFFPGEPLLVYSDADGRMIVVEGNRRLSALKILQNPQLADLPSVQAVVAADGAIRPDTAPCLQFERREDILGYLGFKHITGTKAWGSLEKAIYLNQLKTLLLQTKPELKDSHEEIHKILARQIGSKSPTVGRTLAAYYIYQKGQDAWGTFFKLQGVDGKQVDFSLIYTALSSPSIYGYLGLESATDVAQDDFNYDHGRNLFDWLFRENEFGATAVPDSRQIPLLARVLANDKATQRFKETRDLSLAYRLSDGYINAFEQTMRLVEDNAKELDRLITEIRRNADEEEAFVLTQRHADDLEKIGRDIRNLADDVERIVRKKG